MDQIAEGVIKMGSQWPVIGIWVCLAGLLGWFAVKLWDEEPPFAITALVVALILGIVALLSVDEAKDKCVELRENDVAEFARTNCQALVGL